jgi:hypothetical protein
MDRGNSAKNRGSAIDNQGSGQTASKPYKKKQKMAGNQDDEYVGEYPHERIFDASSFCFILDDLDQYMS